MLNRISPVLLLVSLIFIGCATSRKAPATQPADFQDRTVFNAPKLAGITIDGDPSDWKDNGLRVEVLTATGRRNLESLDARIRVAWDDNGLLVLAHVTDDIPVEARNDNSLWSGDCVEVFVASRLSSRDLAQVIVSPGLDPDNPEPRVQLLEQRRTLELQDIPLSSTAAAKKSDGGYTVEVHVPWDQLGFSPKQGDIVAVQATVTDIDGEGLRSKLLWYPQDGANSRRDRLHLVRLSDKPSAPVMAVATGAYERFRRVRFDLTTVGNYAGKTVTVREGSRTLGSGKLQPAGRLATASLDLPMPAPGESYGTLTARVGSTSLASVTLSDISKARKQAFDSAAMNFSSYVFTGRSFPSVNFENPSYVEDLIGRYELKTTFYDAQHNVVTRPESPGRYGAVVEIIPSIGEPTRRYFTLYRHEEPIKWRDVHFDKSFNLPSALGIDPEVDDNQSHFISETMRNTFRTSLAQSQEMAVMLAALSEISPESATLPRRLGPWERNGDWWREQHRILGTEVQPYRYVTHIPTGAPLDPSGKWPLLIFLHGAGERGDDLEAVSRNGPLKEIEGGRELPFIVVAPQCPAGQWWSINLLEQMLEEVLANHPEIDRDRIYLTGLSMGGFGSWAWSMYHPEHFAAVVPICGGGDPLDAERIKDIPIWTFHGGRDTTVVPEETYDMVAAIRALGGRIRFTYYPNAAHDSWTATYANPELYTWLLQQRKGHPSEPTTQPTTSPSTQPTYEINIPTRGGGRRGMRGRR